jgi:hypothetical protein
MQSLLGSAGLSFSHWLVSIAVASTVLWLVEIEKWVVERLQLATT